MKFTIIDIKLRKASEKDLKKMDQFRLKQIARHTRAMAEAIYVKAFKAEAEMVAPGKTSEERNSLRKEMLAFRKEASSYLLGAQVAWKLLKEPTEADRDFCRPDTVEMMRRAKKVAHFHM